MNFSVGARPQAILDTASTIIHEGWQKRGRPLGELTVAKAQELANRAQELANKAANQASDAGLGKSWEKTKSNFISVGTWASSTVTSTLDEVKQVWQGTQAEPAEA